MEFIANIANIVNQIIESIGYVGIFLLMAIESSLFPFPSEIIMIPAGFLASLGKFNITLVIIAGALGSLVGAIFNYYLAKKYGLSIIKKIGKYVGLTEKRLNKNLAMFEKYGLFSTFIGRLIPGIRQYISLPAGLVGLNFFKFSLLTILGATIWVLILTYLGFIFGNVLVYDNVVATKLSILAVLSVLIMVFSYILLKIRKNK